MSNSSTAWTVAHQAPLSSTVSQSLLKLMFIESVFLTNHLILCHPLLFLPSVFLSIMVFSNESTLYIRWPKYWNLNFSFSPSNKYSGLISFRIDRFDLEVQERLKSFFPAPPLESISSELNLPYGPSLTSVHDYWKNHSSDLSDLCWQSDVSAF